MISLPAAGGVRPPLLAALTAFRPRRRAYEVIVIGVAGALLVLAVIGPWVAPHDPYQSNPSLRLLPAQIEYPLGTDADGRDILSRLLVGARPTLVSAIIIVAVSTFAGVFVAAVAVCGPRWLDEVLMRICDIVLALPALLLALAIAAALGSGVVPAVIALIIAMFPADARLARGVMQRTMTMPFVDAARVLGLSKTALLIRHVVPNSIDEVLVNATAQVGGVTLIMAGLSFIGVGAQPPSAEWGAMASLAAPYITSNWTAAVFPGLLIMVSAVAFALLGDILRVRLNPALRQR